MCTCEIDGIVVCTDSAVQTILKITGVWGIQGDIESLLFDTKYGAKMYARSLFPDEEEHKRYSRIHFSQVYTEADAKDLSPLKD